MIRKVKDKYVLFDRAGKVRLGTFNTKAAAEKKERQIQFFKRRGK